MKIKLLVGTRTLLGMYNYKYEDYPIAGRTWFNLVHRIEPNNRQDTLTSLQNSCKKQLAVTNMYHENFAEALRRFDIKDEIEVELDGKYCKIIDKRILDSWKQEKRFHLDHTRPYLK